MYCKLNGKGYECPSCWEEVKVSQHKQILNWDTDKELHERNFFKLFGILTGTDFNQFLNTPENDVTIWNAIKWVVETPFPADDLPKALQVGDRSIMIPQDLGLCTTGQNIIMRQIVESNKVFTDKDGKIVDYDCYSQAVAIYCQPLLDEDKFDYGKAKKLMDIVDQMPIYLIRPIGFFLLNRAAGYGGKQTRNWLLTLSNLIMRSAKQRLGLPGPTYYRSGKTIGLSTSMQEFTQSIPMMFLKKVLTQ
jgi:hypothetical protein